PFQRPKCDFYPGHAFTILHTVQKDNKITEIDFFISEMFVITYHQQEIEQLDLIRKEMLSNTPLDRADSFYIAHLLMNEMIESFFPRIDEIEKRISEIDQLPANFTNQALIEEV